MAVNERQSNAFDGLQLEHMELYLEKFLEFARHPENSRILIKVKGQKRFVAVFGNEICVYYHGKHAAVPISSWTREFILSEHRKGSVVLILVNYLPQHTTSKKCQVSALEINLHVNMVVLNGGKAKVYGNNLTERTETGKENEFRWLSQVRLNLFRNVPVENRPLLEWKRIPNNLEGVRDNCTLHVLLCIKSILQGKRWSSWEWSRYIPNQARVLMDCQSLTPEDLGHLLDEEDFLIILK